VVFCHACKMGWRGLSRRGGVAVQVWAFTRLARVQEPGGAGGAPRGGRGLGHGAPMTTQTRFAFRIDRDDGESIVEHVAGAEDFQVAMATYHAARKRWPKAAMTLREGTRVIEDSQRSRIGTLFSFPWSEKGREGGGR
jgi:hypothetical protein